MTIHEYAVLVLVASFPAHLASASCDLLTTKSGRQVCGPKLLVGGAMKCGTNTVGATLLHHPRVRISTCETQTPLCFPGNFQGDTDTYTNVTAFWESHMFTHSFWAPNEGEPLPPGNEEAEALWLEKFIDLLPSTDGVEHIAIEKAPSYLEVDAFPLAPTRVKRYLPHAKIVFSVCDPAGRIFSEFRHARRQMKHYWSVRFENSGLPAPRNFGDFAALLRPDAPECIGENEEFCAGLRTEFLSKGEYASGVSTWQSVLGPDRVLVLDMKADPEENARALLNFAELPVDEYDWGALKGQGKVFAFGGREEAYQGEYAAEMRALNKYYQPYNEKLSALLGVPFARAWRRNTRLRS